MFLLYNLISKKPLRKIWTVLIYKLSQREICFNVGKSDGLGIGDIEFVLII